MARSRSGRRWRNSLAHHLSLQFDPWRSVSRCLIPFVAMALGVASVSARTRTDEPPPSQIAARALTNAALADLRLVGGEATPTPRDYQLAATVLAVARSLSPDDQVIIRFLLEAQENAGAADQVEALTRELIRLDPGDTVAQLRLISSRIRRLQKVEDRLATYDRWLGDEGTGIDPSVRSRLAVDAALLARERGDDQGFAERLTRALTLDVTNKDAATLALAFFSARDPDPVGRFELLLAVLTADPIDPDTHLAIARHLAAHGANRGASRFLNNANRIRARLGRETTDSDNVESALVTWLTDGPRTLIESLHRQVADSRDYVIRQRQQLARRNEPFDGVPAPETIGLSMELEWVRLLAAVALADQNLIGPAMDEFGISAVREIQTVSEPATRPRGMSDQEATDRIRGISEEMLLARLISNTELPEIDKVMDALRAEGATSPDKLTAIEGWVRLRAGQIDAAEAAFRSLPTDDPRAAIGLCVASEIRGLKDLAIQQYTELARTEAGTLPGAFAGTAAERLAGNRVSVHTASTRLEELAAAVPAWIEGMVDGPRRFEIIDAALDRRIAGMLEPVNMTVTLRNVSPIPLAVGADRPLNSRLLVSPEVYVGLQSMPTGSLMQVVSLDRRLRLLPREQFEATFWPDSAPLSILLDHIYSRPVRIRYRLMQGFELTDNGLYSPGPYGAGFDCGPLQRTTSIKSNASDPAIVRWAETGTPRELVDAIILLRGRLMASLDMQPMTEETMVQTFAAAGRRLPDLDPAFRRLLLVLVPPASSLRNSVTQEPLTRTFEEAARSLTDPDDKALVIALRIWSVDDPHLTDSGYLTTPALENLAATVRDRLAAGTPCFARPNAGGAAAPAGDVASPVPSPAALPEDK